MNLNKLLCWQCMKNKSKLSITVKVRSMWQCFKNRFNLVFWNVFMTSQIVMFLRRCAPSSGGNATCPLVFGLLILRKKNVAIYLIWRDCVINLFFLSVYQVSAGQVLMPDLKIPTKMMVTLCYRWTLWQSAVYANIIKMDKWKNETPLWSKWWIQPKSIYVYLFYFLQFSTKAMPF